jgi:hypothetical protein
LLSISGCATIDSIFGPPFKSMSLREKTDYCIQWPNDHTCKRWAAGEFKDGFPE